MATKLYVGNLSYDVTADKLKELFGQAGTVVSADVITDRATGRSKGFAFVEMGGDEAAKTAIETLHDVELEGRKLVVNEARPRENRPSGGFGGGSGYRQKRY